MAPRDDRRPPILDPPTAAGPLPYVAAMMLVAASLGGLVAVVDRVPTPDDPSATQDAVLVDLRPLEAGSHPPGDDAPTQAAPAAAAASQPIPQHRDATPPAPAPAATLPQHEAPPVPPQKAAAVPQDAHAGGATPATQATTTDADDSESRRASAHLVTLWQRALMGRLQAARHGLAHTGRETGIVHVAFAIDRVGRLVSERVAQGSGSPALDAAALALVRRAAPFPTPPRGMNDAGLAFVVPIDFKR